MAGLLGDVLPWVYSQGDRAKRFLGGLLSDPVGSAAQTAGLLGDKHREMQALQAQAFPDQSRPFKVGDSKALGQMADAMLTGPLGFAPAGITVWHGSPHRFDKFDSSKIGTGEGAQAYGHGLYLAESPSVAKSYADSLSQYHIATKDGVRAGGDFADALVANAGKYPASLSSAIRSQANKIATDIANGKSTEQVLATMRNGPYARMYAGLADAVENLAPSKAGGSLYKVDLPDSAVAKMLDWDKPIGEQPQAVRDALAKLPKGWVTGAGGQRQFIDPVMSRRTGGGFLEELQMLRRGQPEELLKQQGIPGIRYLDGGSRGAGGGTSNFVVFPGNEGLLSILERNGQPIR